MSIAVKVLSAKRPVGRAAFGVAHVETDKPQQSAAWHFRSKFARNASIKSLLSNKAGQQRPHMHLVFTA